MLSSTQYENNVLEQPDGGTGRWFYGLRSELAECEDECMRIRRAPLGSGGLAAAVPATSAKMPEIGNQSMRFKDGPSSRGFQGVSYGRGLDDMGLPCEKPAFSASQSANLAVTKPRQSAQMVVRSSGGPGWPGDDGDDDDGDDLSDFGRRIHDDDPFKEGPIVPAGNQT